MDIDQYLLPGERRVVAVRRHPAMLGPTLSVTLAVLVVAGWLSWVAPLPVARVLLLLVLAALGRLVWKILDWNVNRFVVTDQRVVLITGVATRRVAMLPLRKVTDMTYQRSPSGRMFGFGDFVMESAGEAQGLRKVTYVPRPDELYQQISELMFGQSRLGTWPPEA